MIVRTYLMNICFFILLVCGKLSANTETNCKKLPIPFTHVENLFFNPSQLKFISNNPTVSLDGMICSGHGRKIQTEVNIAADIYSQVEEWEGTTLVILEYPGTASYPKHFFHLLEQLIGCFAFAENPNDVKRIFLISDGKIDLTNTWKGPNSINEHLIKALFPNSSVIAGSLRQIFPHHLYAKKIIRMNQAIIGDRQCTKNSQHCAQINKHLGEARFSIPNEKMRQIAQRVQDYAEVTPRTSNAFHVTYITRRPPRNLAPNIENLFIKNIPKIPGVQLTIATMEKLSFQEQIQLIGQTDLLIGVHGNGLSHILFLPDTASAIEIFPPNSASLDYRLFADLAGIEYHGMICNQGWQDQASAYLKGAIGDIGGTVNELDLPKIIALILSKQRNSSQKFPIVRKPN